MSITVEPLRWWQLPAVMELERSCFAPDDWSEEVFWAELARTDTRSYLAALEQERLVGYGGVFVAAGEAAIQTLAVDPTRRGQHVGSRLLDALLVESERRGAQRVGLEVRTDNPVAKALYRSRGFAAVGVRRGYYQPSGADAAVMVLERSG